MPVAHWERNGDKFDKCLQVFGVWATFSFVDKHQCFKLDAGNYRKPDPSSGSSLKWSIKFTSKYTIT